MENSETKASSPIPDPVQNTQPGNVVMPRQDGPLVKPLSSKKLNKANLLVILGSFSVVVLGVITGWLLAGSGRSTSNDTGSDRQITSSKGVEEAGIGDEGEYESSVEGILKEGGIKGEGTHYIDRELGESKYVYLTSSVIDLDSFIDKKVTVWGETISAKYASWMIDVGLVKTKE